MFGKVALKIKSTPSKEALGGVYSCKGFDKVPVSISAVMMGFLLCSAILLCFSNKDAHASENSLRGALARTDAFLDQCRQRDEVIPDSEYERLIRLCQEKNGNESPLEAAEESGREDFFLLRLNEVELYTFWAIDGYLGDLVKLHTAQGLLNSCENDLKNMNLWETNSRLTGKTLYLRASILMLEAYRLSQLPRFEEVLPLLERASDLLGEAAPKEKIITLHALGRAYADLAFVDETPEARYQELTADAARTFEEALALSSRQGNFMRTALMAQLGNTLNNMDESAEAVEVLKKALRRVDPSDEPNRFLALHLDIAQTLTTRYLETLAEPDLRAAEEAADRALLVSDSLRSASIVPHVRFNLAMTLFTIALEKRDPQRNALAIHEIEKVLEVWTFDSFTDLHLLVVETLCRFFDVQESMTHEARYIDRALRLITPVIAHFQADEGLMRLHRDALVKLYGRMSDLYFKRALHEAGDKQKEAYDLSGAAAKQAEELVKTTQ